MLLKKILVILLLFLSFNIKLYSENSKFNTSELKNNYNKYINDLFIKFNKSKSDYETKIKSLTKKINELQIKLQNVTKKNIDLNTSNRVLQENLAELDNLTKKYKRILHDKKELIKEVNEVKNNGIKKISVYSDKLLTFLNSYKHSEIQLNDLKKTIDVQQTKIKDMTAKINTANTNISSLKNKNKDLKIKSENQKKTNKLLNDKLNELTKKNQTIINTNLALSENMKKIKAKKVFLENRLNQLLKKNEDLLLQTKILTKKIQDMTQEKKELNNQIIKNKEEISFFKTTTQTQADTIRDLNKKITTLKQKIEQYDLNNNNLKNKLNDMYSAANEFDSLTIKLQKKINDLDKKNNKLNYIKEKFNQLIKERDLQNKELSKIKNIKNDLFINNTKLKQNNKKLISDLKSKDDTIAKLKIELNTLKNKLKSLTQ